MGWFSTDHASERFAVRIAVAGDVVAETLESAAESFAERNDVGSYALLRELSESVRDGDSRAHKGSNGNVAVVIVRNGRVVTSFFRRTNQDLSERALRVDEVRYI